MMRQRTSSDAASDASLIARGRLPERDPIAVIDIGSNSVRLVIYEGLTRALSVLFNEKILSGLGQGIATTGRMDDEAVSSALTAISRFVAISNQLGVTKTYVLATAAAREADNGAEFIEQVEALIGQDVHVLTGEMEAEYAAWGIKCGFHKPSGVVGDLGGGSLELINCNGASALGVTLPLGGLRLNDLSGGSVRKARSIVKSHLSNFDKNLNLASDTFYAVGGTWRSLAKLHQAHENYPLVVLHDYTVPADRFSKFCEIVASSELSDITGIDNVSKNRRDLLPYGAIVMSEILQHTKAKNVSISSLGVREGYLYSLLSDHERDKDPLLEASRELSVLRSRSPLHSEELAQWSGEAFATLGIEETENEARYRIASCYLADIAWRAHSDYQAEQSLGIISNAGFVGIGHPGRAYLAIANYCRFSGLRVSSLPDIARLADERILRRAKLLAAIFRVLYLFSASSDGVIPSLRLEKQASQGYQFVVPAKYAALTGERPTKRIVQLAAEIGHPVSLIVEH